jgi:hypothetical protein
MSPLALSGPTVLALMGAVAIATVLAYLLRPPVRRIAVPSVVIWSKIGAARRRRRFGWRWWISLGLALVVGALLSLVLARPEIRSLGWAIQYDVLVLDDSPTLATRTADGGTRWSHAVARARALIRASGSAARFMVLDTMGYAGIPEYVSRDRALAALDRLAPVRHGTARMPDLGGAGARRPTVLVLTDGVAPLRVPRGCTVISVFEAAENAAVTGFEVRASERDPARFDAFVQIRNRGVTAHDVTLLVRDAQGGRVERTWRLAGEATHEEILDVSALRPGTLEARIAMSGDAFAADDGAFAVKPAGGGRRILLVSDGNPALADALRLLPGAKVSAVRPAGFQGPDGADVCVFDRYAPARAPACPALLFAAPRANWLPPATGAPGKAAVVRWREGDALVRSVAWRNLQLQRAALVDPPAGGAGAPEALVTARGTREGSLVSAGRAERPWIDVGFALQESNFGLSSGFPVFLAEAVQRLTAGDPVVRRPPGTVTIAPLDGDVVDGAGRAIRMAASAAGRTFVAEAPGVYEVRGGTRPGWVVVSEQDPAFGEVNRRAGPEASTGSGSYAFPRALPLQPWMFVLLAAALLSLLEWAMFTRRWTE